MKLLEFITTQGELIMQEWENYARTVMPEAKLDIEALRDHILSLLEFIARDMESPQTKSQQTDKSRGLGEKEGGEENSAAETHAAIRLEEGFDIIQMVSEFRALRASVIKLWIKQRNKADDDSEDIIRFNEAIDQMQMEALIRYNNGLNHSRALFLGTLVHDMRNPMATISNATGLLKMIDHDEKQKKMIDMIERSSKIVIRLISDMIELTRARLKGILISPEPMNIGNAARETAKEAEMSAHRGSVVVVTEGNLDGNWDSLRINQMLSNLIGNALQHGPADAAVKVDVKGGVKDVVLSVHNTGKGIPAQELPLIFDPLMRGKGEEQKESEGTSLGLGLFIVKEIVTAHGGTIEVTSTEQDGTMFTAQLPRNSGPAHTAA